MTARLTHNESRKMIHDLRGPLLTIDGFSNELSITAASILAAIERHSEQLPCDFVKEVEDLVQSDMAPCLGFLQSATSQLEARLDKVEGEQLSRTASGSLGDTDHRL